MDVVCNNYSKLENMENFPSYVKFKGSWRKYQQKVIDEIEAHLLDRHIHIVAPPGSGKTILGLEIARLINKPTIIFTPSIAIRNQWIDRFKQQFIPENQDVDWISKDIFNPNFLTVVTYQAIHSAFSTLALKNGDDTDFDQSFINKIELLQTQTFIIDESHHIKNEWWKTIDSLKIRFNPFIVALTATPPYDVSAIEWQKYSNLNGPIDIEISVPELIAEKDLCPHQDYIYFTKPNTFEIDKLLKFNEVAKKFYNEFKNDEILKEAILSHPVITEPELHLEWIYDNLNFYLACIVFINNFQTKVEKIHFKILGLDKKIPRLDINWMEQLLNYYIIHHRDQFSHYENHILTVLNSLKRAGLAYKNIISFQKSESNGHQITLSVSKLDAIKNIVNFEFENLRNQTRLVILTDFIRKEYIANSEHNTFQITKLGAIPIFESLRRDPNNNIKYAVLTGTIVIIPSTAESAFKKLVDKYHLSKINLRPLKYDEAYLQLSLNESLNNQIVGIITHLFESGEIEVLIGTKSLLGEGWDAPFINTLILASFVGSFVTSNQMRGRAIRTYSGNANKTSNIWHLICLDPTSILGGEDVIMSRRKFKNFIGLSSGNEIFIENGIKRLNVPDYLDSIFNICLANNDTFRKAKDRKSLSENWSTGISNGTKIIEELKIKYLYEKPFQINVEERQIKLKKKFVSALTLAGIQASILIYSGTFMFSEWVEIYYLLNIFSVSGLVIFGAQTFNYFRSYVAHRDISHDIFQIGKALLFTLTKGGFIMSNKNELSIKVSNDADGNVFCNLESPIQKEKEIFIGCLEEIIKPINNPKFIIIRKSKFEGIFDQHDFHSVPNCIAKKKQLVDVFYDQWKRNVGSAQLVNTRSVEGRHFLLKARAWSLLYSKLDKTDHSITWK